MEDKTNKNFKKIIITFIAIIIVLISVLTFLVLNEDEKGNTDSKEGDESIQEDSDNTIEVSWSFNGIDWVSTQEAPSCFEPLELFPPVDFSKITNVLYPGQVRGGDYKPHGGFRFDENSDNKIDVVLPIDANLVSGSRYIESGETQYLLDFIAPCGIYIRFDHLLTLSPELMEIVEEELPEALENDSRTTNFENPQTFYAGTIIATEVGFKNELNVFLDFGVYDLREKNQKAKTDIEWVTNLSEEASQAYYGICWLNNFSEEQVQLLKSLPSSGTEGKNSDYCV